MHNGERLESASKEDKRLDYLGYGSFSRLKGVSDRVFDWQRH